MFVEFDMRCVEFTKYCTKATSLEVYNTAYQQIAHTVKYKILHRVSYLFVATD